MAAHPSQSCCRCAAPARVRILHGYDEARPVIQHYCLSCAESADQSPPARRSAPTRPGRLARVLAACGVGLAGGAVLASPPSLDALLMLSAGALLLLGAVAFRARPGGPRRRAATSP